MQMNEVEKEKRRMHARKVKKRRKVIARFKLAAVVGATMISSVFVAKIVNEAMKNKALEQGIIYENVDNNTHVEKADAHSRYDLVSISEDIKKDLINFNMTSYLDVCLSLYEIHFEFGSAKFSEDVPLFTNYSFSNVDEVIDNGFDDGQKAIDILAALLLESMGYEAATYEEIYSYLSEVVRKDFGDVTVSDYGVNSIIHKMALDRNDDMVKLRDKNIEGVSYGR